jgi:predicted PurR-regulated permease PerM
MSDDQPTTPAQAVSTATAPTRRRALTLGELRLDRKRGALWVVTLAMLAALLYVGWRYVGTVVMGLFVYYVARPVFRRIHTRIEQRTLAVGATLLLVALPILVVVGWAFAILASALSDFLGSESFGDVEAFLQPYFDLAALLSQLQGVLTDLLADPTQLPDVQFGPLFQELLGSLLSWAGVAFTAGIHAFIVLILVFYLLRDDYRLARWARATFLEEDDVLETYFRTVDRDLHNVYFGNILNALLTGLLAAVVYTLLNLVAPGSVLIPESAFLGLLVGVASLIPVIGIKLVTWPVGGYLLARALWLDPEAVWFPVLFLLVSFVVVDYIPDQLLRPYVSGRTLHVGAVMLAYTIGPLLFGWYGIFLAPLLFVVVFEFGRLVFPWLLAPERFETRVPAVSEPAVDAEVASEELVAGEVAGEDDHRDVGPADGVGATDGLTDAGDDGDDERRPGPADGPGPAGGG